MKQRQAQARRSHTGLPAKLFCMKEGVSVLNLKICRDLFLSGGALASQIPLSLP